LDLLAGLSDRDARAGLAEAFKVALIRDAAFYEQLCRDVDRLAARDPDAVAAMVMRCAELHLQHMRESGDPFEQGVARPLDFGHWSAHHLEVMSAYRISHGDAVATGILLDLLYAAGQGWVGTGEPERLASVLRRIGFPLWHEPLAGVDAAGRPLLFAGLDRFREHLGGRLCLTMPDGVGAMRDVHAIDEAAMVRALSRLRGLADRAGAVRS
jgi:3-dehydroquinate synthase